MNPEPGSTDQIAGDSAPSADDVRGELQRILAGPDFAGSRRSSEFLHFVVEEALAGRGERLKAYTIGVRLLGRKHDFDAAGDSIVRTQAGRVRRALEHYYLTIGAADSVRIAIPPGSYCPVFSRSLQVPTSGGEASSGSFLAKPVVAVQALVNLSADHPLDLFARGLSHELAIALARFETVRVLPPPAVEERGAVGEPGQSLHRSDADFILSGTVDCTGGTLRVSLVLQDRGAGEVLWSESFLHRLSSDNAFPIQSRVARDAASTLADVAGVIPGALVQRWTRAGSQDLPFFPAVFRYLNTPMRTKSQYEALRRGLEQILRQAPHHAFAHAMMAEACIHDYNYVFETMDAPLDRALSLARRAVALDPRSQFAEMVLAYAYVQRRELEQFFVHAERCLELNPDASTPTGHIGVCMVLAGEWQRGVALVLRSIELNPNYLRYFHHAIFLDHFRRGEYRGALGEARLFNLPGFFWAPLLRAAALGRLGLQEEARLAAGELLSLRPDFPVHGRELLLRFVHDEKIVTDLIGGLEAAGLSVYQPDPE